MVPDSPGIAPNTIPIDTDKIEKYLAVFKLIFEKMGHESHYNMMMDRNKTG